MPEIAELTKDCTNCGKPIKPDQIDCPWCKACQFCGQFPCQCVDDEWDEYYPEEEPFCRVCHATTPEECFCDDNYDEKEPYDDWDEEVTV